LETLRFTIKKWEAFIFDSGVDFIAYDDGSTDGAFEFMQNQYPQIQLFKNVQSLGLIASLKMLLSKVTS
jgi:hypothetical protein